MPTRSTLDVKGYLAHRLKVPEDEFEVYDPGEATRFLRLNRPHRLQRTLSNGVGLLFYQSIFTLQGGSYEFFTTAVSSLSTVVTAIGAGVGVWGVINLMEGYGGDNPASKSQGSSNLWPEVVSFCWA